MRSQFIDRRTQSERAVAVEVSERGGGDFELSVEFKPRKKVDAVEGVRASFPSHEHRRRRRPVVLHVDDAIDIAH